MIAGDLDLERAVGDPAYLQTILERAGLCAPPAERPVKTAPDPANATQAPYPR